MDNGPLLEPLEGLFQLLLSLREREGFRFSSCEHVRVSPVVPCSLVRLQVEPATLWQQVSLTTAEEEQHEDVTPAAGKRNLS